MGRLQRIGKADPSLARRVGMGQLQRVGKRTPSPLSELPLSSLFSGWSAMSSRRSQQNASGGWTTVARSATPFDAGAEVLRFVVRSLFSRIVPATRSRHGKKGGRAAPVFRDAARADRGEIDRCKGNGIWWLCCHDFRSSCPRERLEFGFARGREGGAKDFPNDANVRHLVPLVRNTFLQSRPRLRPSSNLAGRVLCRPKTAVTMPTAGKAVVVTADRQQTAMCKRVRDRSR